MHTDKFAENFNDAIRPNASRHIDRQTLTRIFVDYRQTFQLLAISARIKHEVVRPDLIRAGRR